MWRASDLDPADGTKTEQVEALVLRRIERGDLSIGSRLPSERVLAERLGLSRVTVVRALDQLRADGVLETKPRFRDPACGRLDRLLDPIAPASTVNRGGPAACSTCGSRRPRRRTTSREAWPRRSSGRTAAARWAATGRRRAGHRAPYGASRAPDRGGRADRAGPAHSHGRCRGRPERRTGRPGPRAGCRRSPRPRHTRPPSILLRKHRLDVVGWPAGASGWDPDQLAHLCRRHKPKVIYLQADNHNPTGLSLPGDRRTEVIETVRRTGAVLISDETHAAAVARQRGAARPAEPVPAHGRVSAR